MVDAVLEILSGVVEGIFDGWYSHQSWWVKTLVWTLIIFIVLAVLFFFFPGVLGFPSPR